MASKSKTKSKKPLTAGQKRALKAMQEGRKRWQAEQRKDKEKRERAGTRASKKLEKEGILKQTAKKKSTKAKANTTTSRSGITKTEVKKLVRHGIEKALKKTRFC